MKATKSKEWELPIEDWQSISIEYAELALSNAEKVLAETAKIAEKVTDRAYRLITVIVPLLILDLAYLLNINNYSKTVEESILLYACLISFCFLSFPIYLIVKVILPYNVFIPGCNPQKSLSLIFLNPDYSPEEQKLAFLINQCEVYQSAIEANTNQNITRIFASTFCIYWLLANPISLLVAYLLLILF